MKKLFAILLAGLMVLSLAACGTKEETEDTESSEPITLNVFAASSMTEAMDAIKEKYEAENENIIIELNLDSSGKLKTQIQNGADCDLFISASQKSMNQLEYGNEANTEELDFVASDTRVDILENKVALCVSSTCKVEINSFEDLAEHLKAGDITFVMGNSDVPVGAYTQKIFEYLGVDEQAVSGCITYGSNVKECQAAISEGTVDCGVVYATDANSADLDVVEVATEEMCGKVIYPAAVMLVSNHPEEAQAFLDYLTGEEASAEFEKIGFTPLSK